MCDAPSNARSFTCDGWRIGDLILKFGLSFGSSFHLAQRLWSLPEKCVEQLRHLAYSIKQKAGEGPGQTSQRPKTLGFSVFAFEMPAAFTGNFYSLWENI